MAYFVTEDGCRIYYETQGIEPGQPVVVFLNGTMQSTVNWKPHGTALKDRFRVVMYDARGQGQSDLGKQKLSLEGHAADLGALLDYLEIKKAHLVGLSHGAKVALAYAAHAPERVDSLVLCSVTATLTHRARLFVRSWLETLKEAGLEAMIWASLPVVFGEGFLKDKARILEGLVKATARRNSKEGLRAFLEALLGYPSLSRTVPPLSIPALVISSSEDPLITEGGARELAGLCRGTHKHVTGIGHSVPSEAPELFNEMVFEFLVET
ncbi:MAG: alpha/beta hydrolase [Thermodesulfobacteriota bacterium]|nr:alpha/beta hydrolase [Thermodesulfobacteriota bacterium]